MVRLDRFHAWFNRGFDHMRDGYVWLLDGILHRRILVPTVALAVVAGAVVLSLQVGTDFFPRVDAGLIQLHVRAPARTRIEHTEQIFQSVEDKIRDVIPKHDLDLVLDNIGLPQRTYNLAFADGSTIGVNDGQILISLREGHAPTADYVKKLRLALTQAFPDILFYFQPADMVTQILNFGVASQIDVQIQGRDREGNRALAREIQQRMTKVPGLVDAHLQQELDAPELYYKIDRTRAQELGLNVASVVNNVNISLSSSEQVTPNFWTDTAQGIPYYLAVQTPEYRISNVNELNETPIASFPNTNSPIPNVLGNVATMHRRPVQSVYNQSNIQPVYDLYASVQNSDLGSVATSLSGILERPPAQAEARQPLRRPRPDRKHEYGFRQSDPGADLRRRLRLSADGRELPEFPGPAGHHPGAARGRGRNHSDALRHRHHPQRALAHGRHHVHRRRLGELDPAGGLRP